MSDVPVLQMMGEQLLTWDDLRAVPDGAHHRYQLVEGHILISPSPTLAHQRCVGRLYTRLTAASPSAFEVVIGPFPFVPEAGTALQPDLLVIRRGTALPTYVSVPPLLAVEVLTPGSSTFDRTAKRELYARHGVERYWVFDPVRPSLTAYELGIDGRYADVEPVEGGLFFAAGKPFAVEFTPQELIGK